MFSQLWEICILLQWLLELTLLVLVGGPMSDFASWAHLSNTDTDRATHRHKMTKE